LLSRGGKRVDPLPCFTTLLNSETLSLRYLA
jgi:hypothetical protein